MEVIEKVDKEEFRHWLYYNLDINDPSLYEEMNMDNPIGIFQMTGGAAQGIIKQVKPQNFEELNAVNALSRPGPIENVPLYVAHKGGQKSPYPEEVNEITESTYKIPIYQEQVMEIFQKIGGFTFEEADAVRGLMKKLGKAEKDPEDLKKWDKTVKRFKNNALKKGLKEQDIDKLTKDLISFASYSFNRCFSGDMKIDRDNKARWSPTIEEMYLTKNDRAWAYANGHRSLYEKYNREGYRYAKSLSEDGRLYLNKIVDIYKREKQDVYKITVESGESIKVSANHKFPTEHGEVSINNGLVIGTNLFVNDGYEKTDSRRWNFTDLSNEERDFKPTYIGKGFQEGKENVAYVNGEYAKFEKNREVLLKKANGLCSYCQEKHNRLECHHIDGNRKNNNIDNLIILCPSCHKKFEYENGRQRKNLKGALTRKEKIISIEYVGEEQTYDVEMEAPYHTLSVNNIVASNSHSTSYTYIAIITLYLAVYFQKYFFSAVLEYEMDRDKILLERMQAIRQRGYQILPPDINESGLGIEPKEDNKIRVGLSNIKFVGEEAAQDIINNRPYDSFKEFVIRVARREIKPTSRVVESLIKSGAVDSLIDSERMLYLQTFVQFWKNKKSTKVREKLEALWNKVLEHNKSLPYFSTNRDKLREFEKDIFGFNFFTSLFTDDIVEMFQKMYKQNLIRLYFDEIDKMSKKVPVSLNDVRVITDKNDNQMAFITLEDMTGQTVSAPVFASYWQHISGEFETDKLYLMNLYRDDKGSILFGQKQFTNNKYHIVRMIKPIAKE